MLLIVCFPGQSPDVVRALLGGEEERHEESWFGQVYAWAATTENGPAIHCSLMADMPRIVERTKRRDRPERFSVGFCDSYAYTGCGLLAPFLSGILRPGRVSGVGRIEIEFVSYPSRTPAVEIAHRLLVPLGYSVDVSGEKLCFSGERIVSQSLRELPGILLSLDRRTRLFLSAEELADIQTATGDWPKLHPARRAIELALTGRPTPLRELVPGLRKVNLVPDVEDSGETFEESSRVSTDLIPSVSISASQRQNGARILARANIDPNWLIYLPAGVASIQEASGSELERPERALSYYRDERIRTAVVEEKHMGSRGIVVVCRTLKTACERFGVDGEVPGCAYTRNARHFFADEDTQAVFLERLCRVLERANFWTRFSTDWVCFDGEIMPWSIKAADSPEESELATAGSLSLARTATELETGPNSPMQSFWTALVQSRVAGLNRYSEMFRHYRSETANLADIRFAPFHLLATEGETYFHHSHLWHMQTLCRLARSGDGFLVPTRYQVVATGDSRQWGKTVEWWEALSSEHLEGLVVKPLAFAPHGRRGLAQPALKCRSREHLRLVYGPQYDDRATFEALLSREALKHRRNKHRRILRQFALSMEALRRFTQRSPMSAVHECVLGVPAQEVAPTMTH